MSVTDILKNESVAALMHVLNPEQDCTRIVGGAVRDALLDITLKDIDLATKLAPQQVMELCNQASFHTVPTGIEFGTVTVVVGKRGFEVTTLREDIATDGRHAKVKFGTDWDRDAARRDFTINALYLDADGKLHDSVGGLDDIKQKRVRFIGKASERIVEDYLRIWRFFRFSAFYAVGNFDSEGLQACLEKRGGLKQLSAERVQQELFKLLVAPRAFEALVLMRELGLTISLLGAQYPNRFRCYNSQAKNSLQGLAALSVAVNEDSMRLSEKLRLSRAQRDELGEIARVLERLHGGCSEKKARVLFYHYPKGFAAAMRIAGLQQYLEVKSPPPFPLKGSDLIGLGFSPGRQLGEALKRLEKTWIESDFSLAKQDLLGSL